VKMAWTLDNRTPHPDEDVRALVEFGAGVDLSATHVIVRAGARSRGWRGYAYYRLPRGNWPKGTRYLIRISLNKSHFDSLWRRHLVAAAAHEGKHVEQFKTGQRPSDGWAVARLLEAESRAWTLKRLAAFEPSGV
jgi:hypothetical protein